MSRAITRHVTLCFPTTAVISSSVIESRSSAGVDGSSLRMRRDPAQQSNRQTEKRATAVSCVGDHKHTLSRPTRSLCCWASVKTQHTAAHQHYVLYVSSCSQAAAWTMKSWGPKCERQHVRNCAAFTFRRCRLKRLEIFRRCVKKKRKMI